MSTAPSHRKEPPRSQHGLLGDTHCHLQDAVFHDDLTMTLSRALDELAWIVIVGDNLASSEAAMAMVREHRVFASVGWHPYHAEDVTPEGLAEIHRLVQQPGAVAIGETGFDYSHYSDVPPEVQERAFIAQMSLASEMGMPIIIHNRDGHDHLRRVLDKHGAPRHGGIMHCFAGDAAFARECLDWGLHVSFAGNVTFPKAHDLREAALSVPMDRLLVETDSPYLAPQCVRGNRCEPVYAAYTAAFLAELRGVEPTVFGEQLRMNGERLLGIDVGD